MGNWTLFSNHGHVLVCLARDSESRLRDVAAAVGITERAVQKIVRDLQQGGMIEINKKGRRNQYRINKKAGLRHELEAGSSIGGLIDFVSAKHKSPSVGKRPVVETQQVSEKIQEVRPRHQRTKKRVERLPTLQANLKPVEPLPASQMVDKAAEPQSLSQATEKPVETGSISNTADKPAVPLSPPRAKAAAELQKDVADREESEKNDKNAKKTNTKSDIEKQQGSLF